MEYLIVSIAILIGAAYLWHCIKNAPIIHEEEEAEWSGNSTRFMQKTYRDDPSKYIAGDPENDCG